MRTSIQIDERLIQQCMELSRLKNKQEIVDTALREFIKFCKRRKMLELEGKIEWEGNLDEMRAV